MSKYYKIKKFLLLTTLLILLISIFNIIGKKFKLYAYVGMVAWGQVVSMDFAILLSQFNKNKKQNISIMFIGGSIAYYVAIYFGISKFQYSFGLAHLFDGLIPYLLPIAMLFSQKTLKSKFKFILIVEILILISHTISGHFIYGVSLNQLMIMGPFIVIPTLFIELLTALIVTKK